jgi:hypothetical protein
MQMLRAPRTAGGLLLRYVHVYMVTQTSDAKFSIGWPPSIFSVLNWREIYNFIESQSVFRRPLWPMETIMKKRH